MNNELQKNFIQQISFPDAQEYFINQAYQFQEALMMYNCAIKEVRTKLEVLNDELSIRYNRNPIEFITSRVKKPFSIVEKLNRNGQPLTVEAMTSTLNDVAGIRVICSFIDDIYSVADMLIKQDDITLLNRKDYIKSPKENGYRSLHLIVEIPVFFSDRKQPMKVEVQIRTIAMDFWASLEHQLKYKKNIQNPEEIQKELQECAEIISQTDVRMLRIKNKIFQEEGNSTPEKRNPRETLKKLNLPLIPPR